MGKPAARRSRHCAPCRLDLPHPFAFLVASRAQVQHLLHPIWSDGSVVSEYQHSFAADQGLLRSLAVITKANV
jgi:hypothetical protein